MKVGALEVALTVLAGMSTAGALWLSLDALARPSQSAERRADLDARILQIERLVAQNSGRSASVPHAVCGGFDTAALGRIGHNITAAADASGATLTLLNAELPSAEEARRKIAPVRLQLRAEGDYRSVTAFLDRLAAAQPQLFVDGLDLVPQAPKVTLKLKAKVFCWSSARP